ncbi:MAG: PEP-CTERM sorting domain-containing protein [Schlesneria sp.]
MSLSASRNVINRHLLGWFCGFSALMLACSSASAGLILTSGTDSSATGSSGYAAVRERNFSNSNGANGTVYVGNQSLLGSGPRGNNTSVAWSQQTYDFTYTYDPTHGIAATTWTGQTTGTTNTSFQSITVPTAAANELSIFGKNTGTGALTLTLNSINSVGNGGILSGTGGSVAVTGGTQLFTGIQDSNGVISATTSSWTVQNNTSVNAYLYDANLFNSGFELFGTITVGSPTTSPYYGNNESSKFEIDLANVPSSTGGAAPVPEPSTISLAALGTAALIAFRWRKRNRNVNLPSA